MTTAEKLEFVAGLMEEMAAGWKQMAEVTEVLSKSAVDVAKILRESQERDADGTR